MSSLREATRSLEGTPLAHAAAGLDSCVHCGFCLQACPTYLVMDDENDSPRGRLVLMRGLLDGDIAPSDPDLRAHVDRCLGCRACETACPSGVPYGHLLEATRATLSAENPRPPIARLVLGIFQRPLLLQAILVLARIVRDTGVTRLLAKIPGSLGLQFAMLEATRPAYRTPDYQPANSNKGPQVVLLRGCVMSGLFAHTNRATHRVLAANGYNVVRSSGDGCCGALHVHAGDVESARAMGKRNIEAFEQFPDASIAINASGCGAMLKEYGLLFEDDAVWGPRAAAVASRARDISELLAREGPRAGGRLTVRVAYDAPCHLMHAQRVVSQPIAVLDAIPGLQRVPLAGHDACCGSAGIYNLLEPDLSQAVLNPKISAILASGAEVVTTGNPGCIMQIGAGLLRENSTVRAVHPVDILDASYASAFETASPTQGAS